jgi:leucine-zipper-like transcriptional regulator 1
VYLMGGKRLDPPSQIFNNVWMLDLSTLVWSMVFSAEETAKSTEGVIIPEPRYFHTASNHRNESIIVFGGLSPASEEGGRERCLDDLAIFDLTKREWRIPKFPDGLQVPPKRYAHVATISRDRLVIVGGELRSNGMKSSPENLLDLHVFDIPTETWVHSRAFGTQEDHIGYYRSVMATAPYHPTNYPISNREEEDRLLDTADTLYQQIPASKLSSEPSSPVTGFRSRSGSLENPVSPTEERRPSRGNLNAIPETDTADSEPYIYIYSTRQRSAREISRLLIKVHSPQSDNFAIDDLSGRLPQRGGNLPLKFPYGDIIGDWLLYCGTIPNQKPVDVPGRPRPTTPPPLKPAAFHILALHIPTQQFKIIDVGSVFLSGSWNRGIVWAKNNSFVVFGNVGLDMNTDYSMRRSNFNHVVIVDLEVFGIYNPPKITTPPFARDLALNMLARKEYSDMDIVTKDNARIPVNSRILAHRWPMFNEVLNACVTGNPFAVDQGRRPSVQSLLTPQNQHPGLPISERPRVLYLPLKQEHAMAFLSYLFMESLPSGLDVPTLCALLVLSKRYAPDLERLSELAADVLHRQLTEANAWQIIEAAALAGRTGLQVQAMLVMRTAADLKAQAQRRREELRNKASLPTLQNGEANGTAVSRPAVPGSTASVQSINSSVVVPSAESVS